MGTFQDKTSKDRILFAVFSHENKSQSVTTLFLLTSEHGGEISIDGEH